MEKILTISVAAYQVEQYIRQNLESMEIPEILDALEVFVVDDGGKDGTLAIAKAFEAKYPGTFHAVHKENGGYGSTVNYTIAHATGKYMKLLDGDDWFDREGLKRLVETLKSTDSDVVITPYFKGPDEKELNLVVPEPEGSGACVRIPDLKKQRLIGMWAITYKTEVVRASGLKLPEHMLYTDGLYSTIPFGTAETIQFMDYGVYCYRIGRDGQSVSKSSRIKHAEETFRLTQMLCSFWAEKKACPNAAYLLHRVSGYYCGAFKTWLLLPQTKENRRGLMEYEEKIRDMAPEVYSYAAGMGKTGALIGAFRKTKFAAYWLLKLVPGGMPGWD